MVASEQTMVASDQPAAATAAIGQPHMAMGTPAPLPAVAAPTAAPRGVVTIPLQLDMQGGLHVQENAHTLALQNVISRAELDAIVAELNATCERHAPSMPAYKALRWVPIARFMATPLVDSRMGTLKRELSATCSVISQRSVQRGINLRVVDEPSAQLMQRNAYRTCREWRRQEFAAAATPHFRIDLEVMMY